MVSPVAYSLSVPGLEVTATDETVGVVLWASTSPAYIRQISNTTMTARRAGSPSGVRPVSPGCAGQVRVSGVLRRGTMPLAGTSSTSPQRPGQPELPVEGIEAPAFRGPGSS